jgi:porin
MKKLLLLVFASLSGAFADSSLPSEQIGKDAEQWWTGDYGTGDWFGFRTELEDKGLEISGGYTAEVWGNTTGGLKRGAVYTGLLDFGAALDLEKLVGWKGASVNTTWLWLSGRDASEDLVGNFLTISNIAGFNTLRMGELWFQQDLFPRTDDGPPGLSIRIGQLAADSEFVISDYGALFTNQYSRRRAGLSDGHARVTRGRKSLGMADPGKRRLSGQCLRSGRQQAWFPMES